ncbi:SDR family NAD(P)-dependent oxidoreductase [Pikeienuella piscinae]|uniref:SDR family NAD(P)-dependent oxidoreductase n=1 Tax=Pikeienuella piscinae TaxID=2748098 RepID=A0A7L5C1W9_9RHOB|nr:SDR family NAD(P)-dependent oxidoreductase [Pikeienuella piscinae]QIE56817.1 SDR family NAD(P)-dependent oxidoreductase [Pikeienuella piscinae]
MGKLEGKTAWITGGGGGIGEAAAKALAASGAHVALSGRRAAEVQRVTAEIQAAGGSAEAAPLDVVDAAAMKATADGIAARRGGIDIHFANAGVNVRDRAVAEVSAEDFARVMDVNVNGVMYGVIAVLPHMRRAGGGTLILTSSWAGRHVSKLTGPAYSASKHGVVAMAQAINAEEGEHGIRCTALMPGEVVTPILQSRPQPPSEADMAKMLKAEDLGETVRFIAEAPMHVCLNEVLISPTWNRFYTGR